MSIDINVLQHTPEQAHQAGLLIAGLGLGGQGASQASCEVAAQLWVGDCHSEGQLGTGSRCFQVPAFSRN